VNSATTAKEGASGDDPAGGEKEVVMETNQPPWVGEVPRDQQLKAQSNRQVGEVNKDQQLDPETERPMKARTLKVPMQILCPDGHHLSLQVLLDTGSEGDLVETVMAG